MAKEISLFNRTYNFAFCFYFLLSIILLLFSSQVFSTDKTAVMKIKHSHIGGSFTKDDIYFLSLLKLALEKSKAEFGPYQLIGAPLPMLQQRAIAETIDNRLDVIWTMTSPERETKLKPIRVPALRGLGGFRIFLIRADEQARFEQIQSEAQLKKIAAGQGRYWPDSDILLANDYRLIQAADHATLMKMLRFKRFDYMPRSVHEIWSEVDLFDDIKVEETLAIYYPSPFYFFVNNDNALLYERIKLGLHKAINDGSFQTFFENEPSSKNVLAHSKLNKRKIFRLENHFMTEETKVVMANEKYIYRL